MTAVAGDAAGYVGRRRGRSGVVMSFVDAAAVVGSAARLWWRHWPALFAVYLVGSSASAWLLHLGVVVARRSGTAPTGNATRGGFKSTPGCGCLALSLVPGTRSQAELIADVDEGVLIQMVQGLHSGVNPVSGDFSTGASGLMIRGGQLAEPVREFTIASTLQRMLKDVVEVGGDIDWLPMSAAGVSLVIRDVTMSGV